MYAPAIAEIAASVFLQSSGLILAGLLAVRLCGPRRPAVQSAILRATLLGVLMCPVVSWMMSELGVSGVRIASFGGSDVERQSLPETAAVPKARLEGGSRQGEPLPVASSGPESIATGPLTAPVFVDRFDVRARADAAYSRAASGTPVPTAEAAAPVITPIAASGPRPSSAASDVSGTLLAGAIIGLVWVAGSFVLLARLVRANVMVARLRGGSAPADATVVEHCDQTARQLGLRSPEVRVCPQVHSPCLVGIRRPVILLPDYAAITPAALREVLLHELAHVARRDCLYQLLSRMATAVLFFQPLVWRLSRRLEQVADDVCDDYVVEHGADRKSYAHTLVDFAERLSAGPAAAGAGLAMVSLRSSLSRRVLRILDRSRNLSPRLTAGWLAMIAVLAVSLTATAALIGAGGDVADAAGSGGQVDNSRIEGGETSSDRVEFSNRQSYARREGAQRPADANRPPPRGPEVPRAPGTATVVEGKPEGGATVAFRFAGRVVDPAGRNVSGAQIFLVQWQLASNDKPLAVTDERGNFAFDVAPGDILYDSLAEEGGVLAATVEGFGLAVKSAHECETTGALARVFQERYDKSAVPRSVVSQLLRNILTGSPTFELVPDDVPLTGQVLDVQGRPVTGAIIRVAKLSTGGRDGLDAWEAQAQREDADYYTLQRYSGMTLGNDVGGTTLAFMPPATTDQDGRFILRGMGRERIVKLLVSGPGIETSEVFARTRAGQPLEVAQEPRNPGSKTIVYHPVEFTHVAGPSQPVEGIVRDARSGQPLAGVAIQSYQLAGRRIAGWTQSIAQTTTDANGRYRLEGLPIGENEVLALSPIDEPYLVSKFKAHTTAAGREAVTLDIELTRGLWIAGRAFDESSGEPIRSGRIDYFAFTDNPHAKQVQGFNGAHLSTRYRLKPDGTFRIPGLPGRGIVGVMADRDHDKYQRGMGADQIEGRDEQFSGFRTYPYILSEFNYHVLVGVNPEEGAESLRLDIPFRSGKTLIVRTVDAQGQPVSDCQYTGRLEFNAYRQANGDSLEIHGYRPQKPRRVQVVHTVRKLAGFLLIEGEEPADLTITLEPWAEISGRIVDAAGAALADVEINDLDEAVTGDPQMAVLPPGENWQMGKFFTDDEGRFHIAGLMPGRPFSLSVTETRKNGFQYGLGEVVPEVTLKPGEVHDLGDVEIKQERES